MSQIYKTSTGGGGGGASSLVTIYNVSDSPATWTKDARTQSIDVYGWGAGGGGSSGAKSPPISSSGGNGGGSGGAFFYSGPASFFGVTEPVIIASGGAGGASITVDGDPENNGSPGSGNTSFGLLIALPGQGGNPVSVANGGGFSSSFFSAINVNDSTFSNIASMGGLSSIPGNPGLDIGINIATNNFEHYPNFQFLPTGGGGGGAGNSLAVQSDGGSGGNVLDISNAIVLAGGTAGSDATIADGGNGSPSLSSGGIISGGTGGGGGSGYSTINPGNGGNGGLPGGGGGGGGGGLEAVANSGSGGNGGNGRIIVIEYF